MFGVARRQPSAVARNYLLAVCDDEWLKHALLGDRLLERLVEVVNIVGVAIDFCVLWVRPQV